MLLGSHAAARCLGRCDFREHHCAYKWRYHLLSIIFHRRTLHRVSKKNCAKLFLSELLQISTNFDNFWQKNGKEAKIMRGSLIFHLT